MPIGRIIRKSISQSKKLAALETDGARLLYTWIIPHLDINGCISGDPVVLNGQILTRLGKSADDVEQYLQDMEHVGLIVRYIANGDMFLCVPDFEEKQLKLRPERESKASIPPPTQEQIRGKS